MQNMFIYRQENNKFDTDRKGNEEIAVIYYLKETNVVKD